MTKTDLEKKLAQMRLTIKKLRKENDILKQENDSLKNNNLWNDTIKK